MTRFVVALAVFVWIPWVARCGAQDPLFVPASPVIVGRGSGEVMLADLDRDGHLDLVTRHLLKRMLAVRLGDGRGFAPAPGSPLPAGRGAYHLAVGDVNEDGRLDVATASFEGDAVSVLLGRRSPTPRR